MRKRKTIAQRMKSRENARKNQIEKRKKKDSRPNMNYYSVDDFLVRGIYFLYKDKKIVYIGMSTENVMERICAHHKPTGKYYKDFDTYSIKRYDNVSDRQLRSIEEALIFKHQPKENKVGKIRKDKSVDVQLGMSTA